MRFSALALAPLAAFAAAQSSSSIPYTTGETFTTTVTVQENGNVFLKTRVEVYTGQALTDPTSGTATTVFTISNSLATYTKTVVETYGKTTASVASDTNTNSSDDKTTTVTYSQEYNTYTKTLTGDSSELADAAATDLSDSDSSASATSSSSNAAGIVGAGLGTFVAVIFLL